MNSKCKRTTLKNRKKCFTARKTYSKQLDCISVYLVKTM